MKKIAIIITVSALVLITVILLIVFALYHKDTNTNKNTDKDYYTFASVDFSDSAHFAPFDNSSDIICIQSASQKDIDSISSNYADYKKHSGTCSTAGLYNAVYYKENVFELLKADTLFLSDSSNRDAPLCYTLLNGPHGKIAVFNSVLDEDFEIRSSQLKTLYSRFLCYTSYFPTIINGRFNFSENDAGISLLEKCGLTLNYSNEHCYTFSSSIKYDEADSVTALHRITPLETPLTLDITGNMVALTYDDGPSTESEGYTDKIISALRENECKATFFVQGSHIADHSSVIKRMYSTGCEIGNHSYFHENFSDTALNLIKNTIEKTNAAVSELIGIEPYLVRPPFGNYRDDEGNIKNIGYPLILWSVDTYDYEEGKTAADVLETIKNNVKNGDIILMHDIHSPSADSANDIILWLKSQSFQLVSVSELFEFSDISLKNNFIYTDFNTFYSK